MYSVLWVSIAMPCTLFRKKDDCINHVMKSFRQGEIGRLQQFLTSDDILFSFTSYMDHQLFPESINISLIPVHFTISFLKQL